MTAKNTLSFPLLLLTALLLASCNFPAPELARPEQPLYIPPLGPTATPLPTPTPDASVDRWVPSKLYRLALRGAAGHG